MRKAQLHHPKILRTTRITRLGNRAYNNASNGLNESFFAQIYARNFTK
jgi:hypothetical protein